MAKVRLRRGLKWIDKKTGFTIRRGEEKEAPEDVVERAGDRLQIRMDVTKKEEKEKKEVQNE